MEMTLLEVFVLQFSISIHQPSLSPPFHTLFPSQAKKQLKRVKAMRNGHTVYGEKGGQPLRSGQLFPTQIRQHLKIICDSSDQEHMSYQDEKVVLYSFSTQHTAKMISNFDLPNSFLSPRMLY
jgi:hypothetical protein